MRMHAASNIPCALVRSLPSVSGAALRAILSAPSCTKKNRAAIRGSRPYRARSSTFCVTFTRQFKAGIILASQATSDCGTDHLRDGHSI
jgi:hypothetical protein